METAAKERQARLAALRASYGKASLSPKGEIQDMDMTEESEEEPTVEMAEGTTEEYTLEAQAKRLLDEAASWQLAEKDEQEQQLELADLVPRKANWDLKKILEHKLEPLEAQTQEAIHELVRMTINSLYYPPLIED